MAVSIDASRAGMHAPVFAAYQPPSGMFDEMFAAAARPHPWCAPIASSLLEMDGTEFASLRAQAERMLLRMGVTFNVYGQTQGAERIFPFDPIPRIIDAETWRTLEAGLIQRVRALNAFVADIYGEAHILKDGLIPHDLILESSQYRRGAVGITPPGGTFITVAGIDLVRGADGRFYVLEDNARTPSGVSYVIENRLVTTRLMPAALRASRVRSVEGYPADLLESLCELAPAGVSRPTVALLTPGPFNSAFFEHVFLSQQMGVELVEGRDLVCVDHKLWMKTVHGLRQIHVLYRRIDDDFLDPVVFRHDSMLGVAGLTAAIRAGSVTIANGIGTGVADDKAVFAYTPEMIRYYLGEQPVLPIVETHLLREPEVRAMVLRDARPDRHRHRQHRRQRHRHRGDGDHQRKLQRLQHRVTPDQGDHHGQRHQRRRDHDQVVADAQHRALEWLTVPAVSTSAVVPPYTRRPRWHRRWRRPHRAPAPTRIQRIPRPRG